MQFAIDTGGTFTDLVVRHDDGSVRMFKAATTPADPIEGVLAVLETAAAAYGETPVSFLGRGALLMHGTTHALNAVITGRTARTALITTEGHRDMLVLREGGRADPFNFTIPFPQPYVPRALTFEVPERITADGSVLKQLDEQKVVELAKLLSSLRVEAVGVCLLWSIVNPVHEERIGALLERFLPGVPITLSHRLNPSIREFRRASSAVIDASLKPAISRYMESLESRLRAAGFGGRLLVVTSQAGVVDAVHAGLAPIHILNSGPSMAPIAGRYYATEDEQAATVIVADTGGTTYDVSLVRQGRIPTTRDSWIGPPFRGVMVGFPWVDVKSVGAGGGSIAWVDAAGLLHVGPKSAGAVPGPAAYGRGGTSPTVTDASLVLGYLDDQFFLGGALALNKDFAKTAVLEKVAAPLKIDLAPAADAILEVATENMVQAIFDITVNQGIDPRDAVLVGGGGAAGLNSVRIARRLGCKKLLIPEVGAALSAAGASMSSLKAEYQSVHFTTTTSFDFDGVSRKRAELERRAEEFVRKSDAIDSVISYKVDARYASQVWEIEVPLRSGSLRNPSSLVEFISDFHDTHFGLFGFSDKNSAIEILCWWTQVTCRVTNNSQLLVTSLPGQERHCENRQAYFGSLGWVDTPVHSFEETTIGEAIHGPAIIESPFTTVVIELGAVSVRRPSGSLSIEIGI
jgi:N-methylhydantoinase A